ncbi:MAG TPA: hypothetical protein VGG33_28475 [Polyangia bacterium]
MPVGSVNSTPIDANYTSTDGTQAHAEPPPPSPGSPTCWDGVDNAINEVADLADSMRDWLTGDATGHDVIEEAKEFVHAEKDAVENCVGY